MTAPRLTNELREQIESLVLQDPKVRTALRTLDRADNCDEKKHSAAVHGTEAAIETSLHNIVIGKERLSERQIDRISRDMIVLLTEDTHGANICATPARAATPRHR